MERTVDGIGLYANANKTEYLCFNQRGDISTLNRGSLKLVDKFTYLRSSVSSTEKYINTRLAKAWRAIDRLSVIWKSNLSDKLKRNFFPSSGCVNTDIWMDYVDAGKSLTAITRECYELYWTSPGGNTDKTAAVPPVTRTILIRRARLARHYRKNMDDLISDVLQWTPSHGREKFGRLARTYPQQLSADMRWSLKDLPEAMDDKDEWR